MLSRKKKRGPAPTGKGELIGVRVQPRQLATLDAWIEQQDKPLSRPEAIRYLIDKALAGTITLKKRSKESLAAAEFLTTNPSRPSTNASPKFLEPKDFCILSEEAAGYERRNLGQWLRVG